MTVLDFDPPHSGLRLVSSNGTVPTRDQRYRTSTPLLGEARDLYRNVLQSALERQCPIDPDALQRRARNQAGHQCRASTSLLISWHLAAHVC